VRARACTHTHTPAPDTSPSEQQRRRSGPQVVRTRRSVPVLVPRWRRVATKTTTTTTTINYNCAAGDVVSHKHTHTHANGDGGGEYVGLRSSGRYPAHRTTDAVVAYSLRCCSRRRLPWWGSAVGAVFGRNRRRRLLCLGTYHPRRATATAQATSRQRQHERERWPCMSTFTSYLYYSLRCFCLSIKS